MSNLLENVNAEQLAAITHREGPLMIVAGAGTGKTTVVTQRIAWLIEQGLAKPENILALTFTDKAAGEMEERVDLLLPFGYVEMQISTFHAFCERLLREHGVEMGLARDFKVLSELDAWLLARQYFEKFALDYYRPLGNPTKHLRSFLTHFSRAKDAALSPEEYLAFVNKKESALTAESLEEDLSDIVRLKELAGAYATYQKILQEHDALDFGDLIVYTLRLLKSRPRVLAAVRAKYSFVLVDEFQDTNHAQYELVKLIAAPKNNLTVVGDDDQSIYKFRGASVANILRFETDYPNTKKIVLTQNYRSVQPILDKAHGFIQANNPNRLEANGLSKKLSSNRADSGIIEHIHCATHEEEAEAVAVQIAMLRAKHPDATWADFGILVRANDAAIPFLVALERAAIPFQFLAMSGLYVKKSLLDLMAYLRVIDNPFDSPSVYRLLTSPLYDVAPAALAELGHLANKKGKSLGEVCATSEGMEILKGESADKIAGLLAFLERMRVEAGKRPVSQLYLIVAKESGYLEWLNTRPEGEKRDEFRFLNQFNDRLKRFEERHDHPVLKHFLAEFQHERDAGEDGALSSDVEAGPDVVRVMTVHASKGLEFRFVFVVSLIDRRFPSQARAEAIPLPEGLVEEVGGEHLEEERRLFYVAMTRAKEGLFLTSAEDYGGTRARKPSRFLHELGYVNPAARPGKEASLEPNESKEASDEIIIEVPKQYSFTQLVAFATCPLQYKFAHVYKIPIFGKWSMSFGKTMHNTLQHFLGKPIGTLEELEALYEENWIDEWYKDDSERQKYWDSGLQSLRAYHAILKKEPPEILMLEQPFTLKIGSVVLKGRIDRIDKSGDGVEIIDYKTGQPKTQENIEDDRKKREQLYLYQLAAERVLGLKVNKLTFHYLEGNTKVSFLGTPKDLLKLEEDVLERVNQIKKGVFDATPGIHCKFCDFRDICAFRARS